MTTHDACEEALLESASAEAKAAKAEGDRVVESVAALKDELSRLAAEDVELIRLLDVLSKRLAASQESLGHLERALVEFVKRAKPRCGEAQE
jgi:hypothetical protein